MDACKIDNKYMFNKCIASGKIQALDAQKQLKNLQTGSTRTKNSAFLYLQTTIFVT